jgi:hypothetical protein
MRFSTLSKHPRHALGAGLAVLAGAPALAPGAMANPATAPEAPTLSALTVIKAGHKTPVDVGGNHLHHGATIRKGTELRRWAVTMHGRSGHPVTLKCGAGEVHAGLAILDHSQVGFTVAGPMGAYGARTITVRVSAAPKVDPDGAHGHVYALCRKV